jgi:hypothetical protein
MHRTLVSVEDWFQTLEPGDRPVAFKTAISLRVPDKIGSFREFALHNRRILKQNALRVYMLKIQQVPASAQNTMKNLRYCIRII